jgi:RNA polymerase sigma-70 factor (ECF subfamily)
MDQSTFQSIYEAHAADVRRLAYWLVRDGETADEITSETFLRAWTSRLSIRTETVKAYLLAIARNLSADHLRRPRRTVPIEDRHSVAAPSAGAALELSETLKALSDLPPKYRDALLLTAIEGLSHEETARILGISAAAAKVRLHRARLMLAVPLRKKEDS